MRERDGFVHGQADLVGDGADARFVDAAPRPCGGRARRSGSQQVTPGHGSIVRNCSVTGFANPRNGPGKFRSAVRCSPKKSNSQSFTIGAVGSGEADFQESSKRPSSNVTSPCIATECSPASFMAVRPAWVDT